MKKILVITGGSVKKLEQFREAIQKLKTKSQASLMLDVTLASFSQLEFFSAEKKGEFILRVGGKDVAEFNVVYIRLVGKRLEDASLLIEYAKQKTLRLRSGQGIRLVDKVYQDASFLPSTISKAMELKKLIEAGIRIPKTLFGGIKVIETKGEELLGFPFIIKGTQGRKSREAWAPNTHEELEKMAVALKEEEKQGKRFFAQKFIEGAQRTRILVVGGRVLGAITRPTKWRTRFLPKIDGQYPEPEKGQVKPVPKEDAEIALAATRAVSLDIAGVDIIHNDATGRPYILEVNAAPRWEAFKKDTGIQVEEEILKFLAKL